MLVLAMSAAFDARIERCATIAARSAGKIILEGLHSDIESKIGQRDIVTESDKMCQQVIVNTIRRHFPEHAILGEEDVEPGREAAMAAIDKLIDSDHLWIVDPIDGTTNFAMGMPLSGVIISYVSGRDLVFGCIYDPFHNEMFTAWRGEGAYVTRSAAHGKEEKVPLSVSSSQDLTHAVLCTGSPPNLDSLAGCNRACDVLSSKVRTVRVLGSAAINLAWVACGRLSAYFETDMNVWDVAAGSLLVREAGGRVTDVWNREYSLLTRNYVASNGKIHDQLTEGLREARMWMPEDGDDGE